MTKKGNKILNLQATKHGLKTYKNGQNHKNKQRNPPYDERKQISFSNCQNEHTKIKLNKQSKD